MYLSILNGGYRNTKDQTSKGKKIAGTETLELVKELRVLRERPAINCKFVFYTTYLY